MIIVMVELKKKSKKSKVISIVGAWFTLPMLGLLTLWLTSAVGQSVTGASSYNDQNFSGSIMLNGLFGLIIVAIILVTCWRIRKRTYFFHLVIGLWIGLGLYSLILVIGIYNYTQASLETASATKCTTVLDKYQKFGSAVVPIGTNTGYGTGFIVDDQGTVLTANHVVSNTTEQYANYSSGRVNMSVVDQAPEYDLALLRLERYAKVNFPLTDSYNNSHYATRANKWTSRVAGINCGIGLN